MGVGPQYYQSLWVHILIRIHSVSQLVSLNFSLVNRSLHSQEAPPSTSVTPVTTVFSTLQSWYEGFP